MRIQLHGHRCTWVSVGDSADLNLPHLLLGQVTFPPLTQLLWCTVECANTFNTAGPRANYTTRQPVLSYTAGTWKRKISCVKSDQSCRSSTEHICPRCQSSMPHCDLLPQTRQEPALLLILTSGAAPTALQARHFEDKSAKDIAHLGQGLDKSHSNSERDAPTDIFEPHGTV